VVSNSNLCLKIVTFGIVGHVAVRLAIYGFLWVVNYNHMRILHGYADIKTERFRGYDLDPVGSHDDDIT